MGKLLGTHSPSLGGCPGAADRDSAEGPGLANLMLPLLGRCAQCGDCSNTKSGLEGDFPRATGRTIPRELSDIKSLLPEFKTAAPKPRCWVAWLQSPQQLPLQAFHS